MLRYLQNFHENFKVRFRSKWDTFCALICELLAIEIEYFKLICE